MRRPLLVLTMSLAATLAWSLPAAAQHAHSEAVVVQPDQPLESTGQTAMGGMDERGGGMMGHRGMMGLGGMMRPGARGQDQSMMMRIIFALMDADGDGAISLPEFQAAHERLFKAMDSNKDGRLSMEEMQNFMRGTTGAAQDRAH